MIYHYNNRSKTERKKERWWLKIYLKKDWGDNRKMNKGIEFWIEWKKTEKNENKRKL